MDNVPDLNDLVEVGYIRDESNCGRGWAGVEAADHFKKGSEAAP